MWRSNMGEGEQRAVMEVRLRLEDEHKMMKVLRNDKRFEQQRGDLTDDLDRVIIDTLHAPMRMNEKVLFLLYSKAMDNKTKQNAKTIFNVISLVRVGALLGRIKKRTSLPLSPFPTTSLKTYFAPANYLSCMT